jgi:hypothetical protein
MKNKLSLLTLFTLCLAYNCFSQRFIETVPGNKDGSIKVWNQYTTSELPSPYIYSNNVTTQPPICADDQQVMIGKI